jgi:hypothetical protein
MTHRILIIIAAALLFGHVAGSLVIRSGKAFGLGSQYGISVAAVLSVMAVVCLCRKPLLRALCWWLGPTALCLLLLAPWAPHYLTLSLTSMFSFILCGLILVEMEDINAPRPNHCEQCGYDLFGSETGACPECGLVWREPIEPKPNVVDPVPRQ